MLLPFGRRPSLGIQMSGEHALPAVHGRRRVAAFMSVALLIASMPVTGSAQAVDEFTDVGPGHVFVSDIAWLADEGITRGCNPPANDRFCPDDPVTRGQMAAFLVRALGLPAGTGTFTDTTGHVFEGDIARLSSAERSGGSDPPQNDWFCPDDPVTRGQMAAFLVRALGLPAGTGTFTDTTGHVFEGDIARLAAADITRGCNPPQIDRFCPDDPVTRGQMAAFLVRALGLPAGTGTFTDTTGHVFEGDIARL